MAGIEAIVMPKWGLAMQEGMVAAWHVEPGAVIAKGQEICDIETSKIANVLESPAAGPLRRIVALPGSTLPVGALLAVIAPAEVSEAEIDAFIAEEARRLEALVAAAVPPPEPEVVEAGGRRLRLLALGEGEATPLVLIHGFGGDLYSWQLNQEALAQSRATYALDLPGHGGSSKDPGTGDVAALAGAVLDLMEAKGLARAHLVGHSLGGAIALWLALEQPERIASATLVAPAGLGAEIAGDYLDGFITTARARKLRPVLEMLVADPALVTAEMVEQVLRFKRLDGAEAALRRVAAACFPDGRQALDLRPRLGDLRVPVQVIVGAADRIIPAAHADGLPAAIQVTRLEATGHLAHMERAEEVNRLIGAFLLG